MYSDNTKNNRFHNGYISGEFVSNNEALSFCSQNSFRTLLFLERKRAERSQKPFLLVLIDISKLSGKVRSQISKKLASTICNSSRDTDIKGWYRYKKTMGICFTEIAEVKSDILFNKLTASIKSNTPARYYSLLSFELHHFPQENAQGQNSVNSNIIFYTEKSKKSFPKQVDNFAKRSIDILGSIIFITLFSPFFLIISVFIKLDSGGPVFFRQNRVGKAGKMFTVLKFRTMHENNAPDVHQYFIKNFISGSLNTQTDSHCRYKIQNDMRVTRVGHFLRKTSLDELPQFFNVLRGEMSLVGPRPAIPYEVEEYGLWHRRRALEVKPGITGIWQVSGRSRTRFDQMVRMDIRYIERSSLWLDFQLMLQTPFAVLRARGAC
ncbi:Undecaprenyl-phosphate galactosephosphotransferase [Chitinispirillum alkaliphilum]|nr:Undecaprenyl-phosphate galactosephosphotransferase [Chitinispirillum alkaliphilum]